MKNSIKKTLAVGMTAFLATNVAVHATILYNNSTTDTLHNLNLADGTILGDQVNLGAGVNSALITSFSFELSSVNNLTGTPQIQASLYNNNLVNNGYSDAPGTLLYQSSFSSIPNPNPNPGGGFVYTLVYNLATPVLVGNTFTLALSVTGLTFGDAGVALFNSPTTGSNFGDYWSETGGVWTLNNYYSGQPTATGFGAEFFGTVPDTASTAMLLGAGFSGLVVLRRKLSC